ncbi:MAG: hypothetical protein LUC45_05660 [Paraprevotella sp.]|nr:hypothetical protein [Paraprevotella sp.]
MNIDGENHDYLLMDGYGTPTGGTTIKAVVSVSSDGVYLLQFVGKDTQTVKVMK